MLEALKQVKGSVLLLFVVKMWFYMKIPIPTTHTLNTYYTTRTPVPTCNYLKRLMCAFASRWGEPKPKARKKRVEDLSLA